MKTLAEELRDGRAAIQRLTHANQTLAAQNAMLKELVLRMVRIPAATELARAPATSGPASAMDVGSLLLGEAIGFTVAELLK